MVKNFNWYMFLVELCIVSLGTSLIVFGMSQAGADPFRAVAFALAGYVLYNLYSKHKNYDRIKDR